jgi:molecular chaperone HscB
MEVIGRLVDEVAGEVDALRHRSEGLEALADEVSAEQRRVQQELARLLDEVQDPLQAVGQVRALMFIERFEEDLNNRLDRLEDA